MKREAEANAAEDAKHREEIEVRNHADSLVYTTERTLREHGDKVSAEDKAAVEAALNEAREALKGSDIERIKQTQEALQKASHKVAEAMYRAQAAGAGAAPGEAAGATGGDASGAPGDQAKGDVIDAEFKDLGDTKK
jgi:molecular chaperone DnaK